MSISTQKSLFSVFFFFFLEAVEKKTVFNTFEVNVFYLHRLPQSLPPSAQCKIGSWVSWTGMD